MTREELKQLILSKHNLDFANKPGMVYQIWEDGEITLQKSGPLLWQRTLHCIECGLVNLGKDLMPIQESEHGYAFVENKEIANQIRKEMFEFSKQLV